MPKKGQTWTPEQRAKILAAKQQKATADVPAPEAVASPPVRQRVQYEPRPEPKPGSRWEMANGTNRWDDGGDQWSGDMPNELQIPPDKIPEGLTLQWVTDSVYGDSVTFAQRRASFEKTGWNPVHHGDFRGLLEGMYAPVGTKGEINKGGLVLMAKPTEMAKKSELREKRKAQEQVQIKEASLYGGEIDAMGADHPSAKRFNHVKKSMERIKVPTDD